ncbi:MAG TPA: TonB-dependent receptor [Longimicrobiales bacterium]|nr:TonB-dependent receptor [Longimicrobiales bacterium]
MTRLFRRSAPLACTFLSALAGSTTQASAQEPFLLDTLQVEVDSRLAGNVGSVEVITAEQLTALPIRTLEEALSWSMGVDLQTRSPAQADLSIRGSTFEQVLVLVDGVRMSDPQTGHFDLDLAIPLDRVERIEILRGPASAVYGADALGGVVNIVTRDRTGMRAPTGQAHVEGGTFSRWGWGVDTSIPAGAWAVSTAFSQDASDGHREGTDYRIFRSSGRLAGAAAGGRLVLDGSYGKRDFGASGFYAPFESYEETRTTTGTARWTRAMDGGGSLESRVSWRRHEDDFILQRDDPDFYRNLHDSRQWNAELTGRIPLGGGSALAVGGEWSRESLESTNLGDREQEWRAAFGELALRTGALRLQGGLRWDDRDDVGSFVSPSASATLDMASGFSLRGAWGRSFRAPTWTERYYVDPANVGNPDLEVERGWSAELGALLRTEVGRFTATVYRRETENLIDWARPDGADETVPWETRNVEEARFDGLELAVEGIRYGSLTFRAGASWIDLETEEEGGYFSKSSLRPVIRDLTAGVSLPLPDRSTLHLVVADRTRLGEGGSTTLDLRLDIGFGSGTLYIDARNLTDADDLDLTGNPVAGRSFSVGVRSPFGN